MATKGILSKQTVDFHKPNTPLPNWNDPKIDIHLHKRRNGKKGIFDIAVPLNSERPVRVEGKTGAVPNDILDEVEKAFRDVAQRKKFVNNLIAVLSNYPNFKNRPEDMKNIHGALKKIATAFGLDWQNLVALTHTPSTNLYKAEIRDESYRVYYVSIDRKRISAGNTSKTLLNEDIYPLGPIIL